MTFPVKAVANELLEIAWEKDINDVTPMKLQKLVYYAHGWWFGAFEKPLIDDQIEAWTFGPVVPDLYNATREYGNQPITKFLTEISLASLSNITVKTPRVPKENKKVRSCLEWIIESYGNFNGIELSNLSHEKQGPWDETVCENIKEFGSLPKNTDIPPKRIKEFFAQKLSEINGE
ncbi:Panacea domain-containing protein [Aurantivibrio infirmus]